MNKNNKDKQSLGLKEPGLEQLHPLEIVNTVREPLLVLDSELRVMYANPSFYNFFKVKPDETEGTCLYDLGSGQWDIKELREILGEILSENKAFNDYEVHYDCPYIGVKIMLLNARMIQNREDNYILLAMEDVTERRKADERVRDSEEKYNTLVEELNSIIIGFDDEGRITFFNKFSEQIFGYDRDEVTGKKIVGLIINKIESDGSDNTDLIENMKKHPEEFYYRKSEGQRKDGEKVFFQWSLKKLSYGKRFDYLIDGNDITDAEQSRARMEEERRLAGIGVMAVTVSHELRNPLAAIKMSAANIRRKNKDASLNVNLDRVDRKVTESAEIINNLLYYSEIRIPKPAKQNIGSLLDEALSKKFRKRHTSCPGIVRKGLKGKALYARVDGEHLKQALCKLLDNACDAVSPGEGRIVAGVSEKDGAVSVTISDNGKGMSEEEARLASEPFFTTKAKGTGLGLTIAKALTELNGGSLRVESEEGRGTAVTITLRLIKEL